MPEYRRYQPHQTSSGRSWMPFVVAGIVVIGLFLLGRAIFGGKGTAETKKTANTNAGIVLVNDGQPTMNVNAVNGNINGVTNTNTTNTNSTNSNVNSGAAAAGSALSGTLAKACAKPISQYGEAKNIAVTFDVAGGGTSATQALTVLQQAKVPASFFSSGKFADGHKDLLSAIVKAGFPVYNRTYDGTSLKTMTATQVADEFVKGDNAIRADTGQASTPFARPPLGETSDVAIATAASQGYCLVTWTVDAFDWDSTYTADQSVQRVVDKLRPGMIIALHLGYDITPAVIQSLVPKIKAQGYTLVSLSTLMGI